MVLLTLIARASDGELLSGSVQEAEEVSTPISSCVPLSCLYGEKNNLSHWLARFSRGPSLEGWLVASCWTARFFCLLFLKFGKS